MSKKGIAILLLFILLGWIAFVSYWYVCKIRGHCLYKVEVIENHGKKIPSNTFTDDTLIPIEQPKFFIEDGDLFSLSNNENISFVNGTSEVTIPTLLSKDLEKLADFLKKNENKNLRLSGLYKNEGSNNIELGSERADKIKDYFATIFEIDKNRIITETKLVSELIEDANHTYGAIEFDIINKPIVAEEVENKKIEPTIEEIKEVPKELAVEKKETQPKTTTPIESFSTTSGVDAAILKAIKKKFTMYYPPNTFYMNTTSSMDSYFKKLAKYFKQNPNGLIELKGYSDYENSDISLKSIGKEKATRVKNYLVKNYGINPINLKTKGSSRQEPQFSEIEKAKNRKVTFTFIK